MSDIGPHETSTSFEILYDRKQGPPIEVDIEISGIVYCDDPECGIEARDITAKICERELTDEEIEYLDLAQPLSETFIECEPCSPRVGETYKGSDGYIWSVIDVCLNWGEPGAKRSRYVLLERPTVKWELERRRNAPCNVIRRIISLGEFDQGVDIEGKPLFTWVRDEPVKPGQLRTLGDMK